MAFYASHVDQISNVSKTAYSYSCSLSILSIFKRSAAVCMKSYVIIFHFCRATGFLTISSDIVAGETINENH